MYWQIQYNKEKRLTLNTNYFSIGIDLTLLYYHCQPGKTLYQNIYSAISFQRPIDC